jgi:drug/metabolite transporter (DMT)-like permease
LSTNLRAALFMALSMFGFTANDAITKGLTDDLNLGQIMLVRGLFATVLIALYAWQQGALSRPSLALQPLVALRAGCELAATLFFLNALAHMPIANISAVLQSLPLAVTMGAALFFGERVRWRRWLAILVGFVGVLVIVRPGLEGFNAYSLSVLGCVVFAASRDLFTRQIPVAVPSLLISTATAALVTICGGVLVIPLGGWTPIGVPETAQLAAAAVLLLVGYQFIILAMRTGEIAFVAPYRYTALLWAILFGMLMFGEWPDAAMLVGAGLIVGSGLYSLYRERKTGRARPIEETTGEGMAPDGM